MEISELVSYKKSHSSLRVLALTSIVSSALIVLLVFLQYTSALATEQRVYANSLSANQWVLDPNTGAVYNMSQSAITEESKIVEYEHHVTMVYKSFYEFDPFENFQEKLGKGLELVDQKIGVKIISAHDKVDLENRIKSEGMHIYADIDSILLDINPTKISGIAFGKQKIIKGKGKGLRHLDYEFEMIPLEGRTANNPHGVVITKWILRNNEPLEVKNKMNNGEH